MSLELIYRYFARTVFVVACAALVVAAVEWFSGLIGLSVTGRVYSAGRLIELAGGLLMFVVVDLLMQIRDEMRSRNA